MARCAKKRASESFAARRGQHKPSSEEQVILKSISYSCSVKIISRNAK